GPACERRRGRAAPVAKVHPPSPCWNRRSRPNAGNGWGWAVLRRLQGSRQPPRREDALHRSHDGHRACVQLDVDPVTGHTSAEGRSGQRLRDEVQPETAFRARLTDGQTGPVDGHEPFGQDVLHPRGWHGDFHRRLTGTNLNSSDLPRTRDVTRDFVTAQLVADAITALDVDDR